jgi:hypothetical protein
LEEIFSNFGDFETSKTHQKCQVYKIEFQSHRNGFLDGGRMDGGPVETLKVPTPLIEQQIYPYSIWDSSRGLKRSLAVEPCQINDCSGYFIPNFLPNPILYIYICIIDILIYPLVI